MSWPMGHCSKLSHDAYQGIVTYRTGVFSKTHRHMTKPLSRGMVLLSEPAQKPVMKFGQFMAIYANAWSAFAPLLKPMTAANRATLLKSLNLVSLELLSYLNPKNFSAAVFLSFLKPLKFLQTYFQVQPTVSLTQSVQQAMLGQATQFSYLDLKDAVSKDQYEFVTRTDRLQQPVIPVSATQLLGSTFVDMGEWNYNQVAEGISLDLARIPVIYQLPKISEITNEQFFTWGNNSSHTLTLTIRPPSFWSDSSQPLLLIDPTGLFAGLGLTPLSSNEREAFKLPTDLTGSVYKFEQLTQLLIDFHVDAKGYLEVYALSVQEVQHAG